MAGTQSVGADDPGLRGIPRSRRTVAGVCPQYGGLNGFAGFPAPPRGGTRTKRRGDAGGRGRTPSQPDAPSPHEGGWGPPRAGSPLPRANVVRVRPGTSGSITDLLLALACVPSAADTAPQREANGGAAEGLSGGRDDDPPSEDGGEAAPVPTLPFVREPEAIGRRRSHSLSESTRQITPPIRSGHAPPSEGSRKGPQPVHPGDVLTR